MAAIRPPKLAPPPPLPPPPGEVPGAIIGYPPPPDQPSFVPRDVFISPDITSVKGMRRAIEATTRRKWLVDDDIIPYIYAAMFTGEIQPVPYDIYNKYLYVLDAEEGEPVLTLLVSSSKAYYEDLTQAEREAGGAGGAAGKGQLGEGSLYESVGAILGMGGRAAREMAYQDPASFINLIATEAAGDKPLNQMLRNFLISQAPRLYSLAGLEELLGRTPEAEAMTTTQDIFKQFVTPGAEFVGGRKAVVKSLAELATKPERQPGFAEAAPRDFFDDAFFLVQNTLAPTMTPTAASTLFGSARRELERAQYVTAVTRNEFTGSPLEWLQKRGYF